MVEIDLEDPYTKEQFDKYMLELEENAKKWWMVPNAWTCFCFDDKKIYLVG